MTIERRKIENIKFSKKALNHWPQSVTCFKYVDLGLFVISVIKEMGKFAIPYEFLTFCKMGHPTVLFHVI